MKNRFLNILLVIISIYLFIGIIHTHIAVQRNLKIGLDSCKKISKEIIQTQRKCTGTEKNYEIVISDICSIYYYRCVKTPPSYRRWLFDYGLYWTIIGWPGIYEPIENGADMRGG